MTPTKTNASQMINAHGYKHLSSFDLSASLVVFMVALPLSLGIALASGVAPAAGLITAIIGGVVAGFFSGAPLVVSGPAAGLTAMVLETVNRFGIAMLGPITVLAGFFQLLFGALRLGKFVALIPMAVLEGVLCAIGAIIAMSQLHVLLGYKAPAGFINGLKQIFPRIGEVASNAGPSVIILAIGVCAIAIQIVWNKKYKGRLPIPGALPAVVVGTLLSLKFDLPRVELAPLGGTMLDALSKMTDMQWLNNIGNLIVPAAGLALVAAAETLLTARAVDILAAKKNIDHVTQPNQELLAQGAGNILAGFLGGIPMTGVMVRTAANVNSGAQSRYSAILHGVWVAGVRRSVTLAYFIHSIDCISIYTCNHWSASS